MSKEHLESLIENKIVLFDASSASEYLKALLQLDVKYKE